MSAATRILETGRILGRYQLLDVVATGGMGCVWAARQLGALRFQKLVAVKVSHPALASQADFRDMFLDEAALASSVQHPNVCAVLDLGEDGEALYLVLEWISGVSLSQLLSVLPEHRLSARLAAWIVAEASAGLHAAHELKDEHGVLRELVHRDVSPQNILLTSDGHVKVADFGIARARDQLHQITETGQVKGKLSYMAPEQLRSRDYDRRVDVYALGCVLYSASVGKKAFSGESSALYQILEGRFAHPREVISDYPRELEAILLRAMGPVDTRFETADELRTALLDWLRTQPPLHPTEVANVLERALGPELEERARSLRDVAARLDALAGGQTDRIAVPGALISPVPESIDAEADTRSVVVTNLHVPTAPERAAPATSRRKGALVLGAIALVGAGLAIPLAVASRTSPPMPATPSQLPGPSSMVPVASPLLSAAPSSIRLAVDVTPRNASVTLDGEPQPAPLRAELPRDSRTHIVQASAPGYATERYAVVFDQSRELAIELAPSAASAAPVATTRPLRAPRAPSVPSAEPPRSATPAVAPPPPTSRPIDTTDVFGRED